MRTYDLTPLIRTSIGFDRMTRLMDAALKLEDNAKGYPPYNIAKKGEDEFRITLAVAGFRPEEIDITAQQNLLQVIGRKDETNADRSKFLHVGIANRSFERRFELADFVRVEKADLAEGLLVIELVREVPEAMKPKKIAVNGGHLVDINKDRDAA